MCMNFAMAGPLWQHSAEHKRRAGVVKNRRSRSPAAVTTALAAIRRQVKIPSDHYGLWSVYW
jgi:hypothetical protein